jgi:hypothetical protein
MMHLLWHRAGSLSGHAQQVQISVQSAGVPLLTGLTALSTGTWDQCLLGGCCHLSGGNPPLGCPCSIISSFLFLALGCPGHRNHLLVFFCTRDICPSLRPSLGRALEVPCAPESETPPHCSVRWGMTPYRPLPHSAMSSVAMQPPGMVAERSFREMLVVKLPCPALNATLKSTRQAGNPGVTRRILCFYLLCLLGR